MQKLPSVDNLPNKRYQSQDGRYIPSVTELLSFIDSESLISWANWMGRKGRDTKDILRTAATYGTDTHNAIYNYLNDDFVLVNNASYKCFLKWWKDLNDNHEVEIVGKEEPLIGPYFAGTYDLLIKRDGKYILVDYKTSNHVQYKYFLQMAAYRYLLYQLHGIVLDGCLILHLGKVPNAKYHEFELDFSNKEHYDMIEACFQSFLGILYSYYNVYNVKNKFNTIFHKK